MILDDFSFRRKYFVKNLLHPNSLVRDASILEFASFNDFAMTYLKDRLFDLSKVHKIIVPVENAEEVTLLFSIKPDVRPFLIIYLKDFSKETRDAFRPISKTTLLCDSKDIPSLKHEMIESISSSFCEFMQNTYGYFRDCISAKDIDDIPYIYSDSFFELPFFCIADIRWMYHDFDEVPLKSLHGIVYNTRFLASNLLGQQRSIDFKVFGCDGERQYKYDYMRVINPKRLYIEDGYLYVDSDPNTKFNLYEENHKDASSLSQKEIDMIRCSYDVKFSDSLNLKDTSFVSIKENRLCMGNAAMIPFLCSLVTRTLNGGNV